MTNARLKRVVAAICFAALCLCAAYFQLFNRTAGIDLNYYAKIRAKEISAAAEAVRNAAIAQPQKFGIEKGDVQSLRIVDSVPSARPGYRHVYVAQEVNGIPISNTLLSTIVKFSPIQSEDDIMSLSNTDNK